MNWIEIITPEDAEKVRIASIQEPARSFVIFKNSTRCGTSRMSRNMFESEWNSDMPVYFVNVIENRAASNKIAAAYNVRHESPQLLVIRNGHCVYNSSHSNIDAAKVLNVTSEPL